MEFTLEMQQLFDLKPEACFQSYTSKVPGKLFVAGEYAILEAGNPAILFAVNQYLSCSVSLSMHYRQGTLCSNLPQLETVCYEREHMIFPESWQYVVAAMHVVEEVIQHMQRPIQDYQIHLSTDLISEQGEKYGLGSSGAVTVATIQALLRFYGLEPKSPLTVYKLAAIALVSIHTTGSLADIATNCFGGWVYYCSPSRKWLSQQLQNGVSISSLLVRDWPYLVIEPLTPVQDLSVLIGWTQSPVSTDSMIRALHQQNITDSTIYQRFVQESASVVLQMKRCFESGDILGIQAALADSRHLLLNLSEAFGLTIETPELRQLIAAAQAHQFEAKSSGAGGGDCGIALGSTRQPTQALLEEWYHIGIQPLNLGIAPSQSSH